MLMIIEKDICTRDMMILKEHWPCIGDDGFWLGQWEKRFDTFIEKGYINVLHPHACVNGFLVKRISNLLNEFNTSDVLEAEDIEWTKNYYVLHGVVCWMTELWI